MSEHRATPALPLAPVDPRTGLEAARFALYVHFPWCLSKCPYCDFASVVSESVPAEDYTRLLGLELEARVLALGVTGRTLDAVYVGGGTPSLWPPDLLSRFLERTASLLTLPARAEISLEANPGAADEARFAGYRRGGVNRLSIGVQSFQAQLLEALGRRHDAASAERAVAAARAAGFDNVSVDLIYGVQGQTVDHARADARRAAALETEHVSAYALTLDREALAQEVPLARQLARGEVELPSSEAVVEMQRAYATTLGAAGLERYEVSNYARPGYHSRHNAAYWTGGEYLAIGAGAVGRVGTVRYSNHRGAQRYGADVDAGRLPQASEEVLAADELFAERLSMGLRLVSGVDVDAVAADFGRTLDARRPLIGRLVAEGLAAWRDGRLALTPRGLDVHSSVAAALL